MPDPITLEEAPAADPVVCSACNWRGLACDLLPPDGAILTPGDPSPAGRCPVCESLAYLDTPLARAEGAADRVVAVLRRLADPEVGESAFRAALDDARKLLAELNTPAPPLDPNRRTAAQHEDA